MKLTSQIESCPDGIKEHNEVEKRTPDPELYPHRDYIWGSSKRVLWIPFLLFAVARNGWGLDVDCCILSEGFGLYNLPSTPCYTIPQQSS